MENTKECSKCGLRKTFEEFSPFKQGRYGLNPKCKKCNALYVKNYRKLNPVRLTEKQRTKKRIDSRIYYVSNKENILQRQRRFEKTCISCNKEYKAFYKNQKCCSKKCLGMIFRKSINEYFKINKIREHRIIMEKHLGRKLNPNEVVHHINGLKRYNRISNLIVFSSNKKHMQHHYSLRKVS